MSYSDLVPPRASETVNFSVNKNNEIDELPSSVSDTANFSRIRYKDHDEIAQQTVEFIARGGNINYYPIGLSANTEALPVLRNEYTGEVSLRETRDRMNSQQKAAKQNKKMKTDKPTNDFGEW